jgi:hypothetical protein
MNYLENYKFLKSIFNQQSDCIEVNENNIRIFNYSFLSDKYSALPNDKVQNELFITDDSITSKLFDQKIGENIKFRYSVFTNAPSAKLDNIVIFLHGLNERYWDKYLPWAKKIVELTHKAAVLFPIAFHINRSPSEWSDPRLMSKVSKIRNLQFPQLTNSTYINAALSYRIHMSPERLFWLGLQTIHDIIKLVTEIRSGKHTLISQNAQIDFFSYSIGCLITEIMLMANPENLFSESKLIIFCGGSTFDRMRLNSKYILDSEATTALMSYFLNKDDLKIYEDTKSVSNLNNDCLSEFYFNVMLNYQNNKNIREKRLNDLSHNIFALALKNDQIMPLNDITLTLKGYNDIPINIEILDFPYKYHHAAPFPTNNSIQYEVDKCFNEVFNLVAQRLM